VEGLQQKNDTRSQTRVVGVGEEERGSAVRGKKDGDGSSIAGSNYRSRCGGASRWVS
jgi:hypothetical protein